MVLVVGGGLHPGPATRDGIVTSHKVNGGLLTTLFISFHSQGTSRYGVTRDWRLFVEWVPGVVYLALVNQGESEVGVRSV